MSHIYESLDEDPWPRNRGSDRIYLHVEPNLTGTRLLPVFGADMFYCIYCYCIVQRKHNKKINYPDAECQSLFAKTLMDALMDLNSNVFVFSRANMKTIQRIKLFD